MKGAGAMWNVERTRPTPQEKGSTGCAAAGLLMAAVLSGLIVVASERSDAVRQPELASVPAAMPAAPGSDGLGRAGASSLAPLGSTVPIAVPAAFHDATPPGLPGLDQSNIAWGDYDNDGLLDFL